MVNPVFRFRFLAVILEAGMETGMGRKDALMEEARGLFQEKQRVQRIAEVVQARGRNDQHSSLFQEELATPDAIFWIEQVLKDLGHEDAIKRPGTERGVDGVSHAERGLRAVVPFLKPFLGPEKLNFVQFQAYDPPGNLLANEDDVLSESTPEIKPEALLRTVGKQEFPYPLIFCKVVVPVKRSPCRSMLFKAIEIIPERILSFDLPDIPERHFFPQGFRCSIVKNRLVAISGKIVDEAGK